MRDGALGRCDGVVVAADLAVADAEVVERRREVVRGRRGCRRRAPRRARRRVPSARRPLVVVPTAASPAASSSSARTKLRPARRIAGDDPLEPLDARREVGLHAGWPCLDGRQRLPAGGRQIVEADEEARELLALLGIGLLGDDARRDLLGVVAEHGFGDSEAVDVQRRRVEHARACEHEEVAVHERRLAVQEAHVIDGERRAQRVGRLAQERPDALDLPLLVVGHGVRADLDRARRDPRQDDVQPQRLVGPQRRQRRQRAQDRARPLELLAVVERQRDDIVGEHPRCHEVRAADPGSRVEQQDIGGEICLDLLLEVEEGVDALTVVDAPLELQAREVLEVVQRGVAPGGHELQPAAFGERVVHGNVDQRVAERERRLTAREAVAQPAHEAVAARERVIEQLVREPRGFEVDVDRDDLASHPRSHDRDVCQQQRPACSTLVGVEGDGPH